MVEGGGRRGGERGRDGKHEEGEELLKLVLRYAALKSSFSWSWSIIKFMMISIAYE